MYIKVRGSDVAQLDRAPSSKGEVVGSSPAVATNAGSVLVRSRAHNPEVRRFNSDPRY